MCLSGSEEKPFEENEPEYSSIFKRIRPWHFGKMKIDANQVISNRKKNGKSFPSMKIPDERTCIILVGFDG